MKVYKLTMLSACDEYGPIDNDTFAGIFSSYEKAEAAIERWRKLKVTYSFCGDIEEITVDEIQT